MRTSAMVRVRAQTADIGLRASTAVKPLQNAQSKTAAMTWVFAVAITSLTQLSVEIQRETVNTPTIATDRGSAPTMATGPTVQIAVNPPRSVQHKTAATPSVNA